MENQAILDAILGNPEDDALRLIYADWFEEHGLGVRAEFIRLQCELAQKARYDPSRQPLLKREQEILAEHGADWAKPVAAITTGDEMRKGPVRNYKFHRGFVDTVSIGGRKLLTHGAKLFRLAPIRNVRITRLGSSNVKAADLASCNLLSQIRGLVLQGELSPDELRTLLTAPGLKRLTALTLEGYFEADAIEPLLAGCLPHLEKLDLNVDMSVLTTAHVQTLAKARWASALKHLDLRNHFIRVGGVQAIAASRNLTGLSVLILNHCEVGLAGTQALAESSNLTKLATLDLRGNRLTDSAARALAASTALPGLTELYLGMNKLGPDGARALASWPGLARLRLLHLYSNPIGDDGVCALAASPHVANLWRLDITETGIGERGARALAESPYLKNAHIGPFKGDDRDELIVGAPEAHAKV
jgi:uncharacterized protein (TIGR02996 family)